MNESGWCIAHDVIERIHHLNGQIRRMQRGIALQYVALGRSADCQCTELRDHVKWLAHRVDEALELARSLTAELHHQRKRPRNARDRVLCLLTYHQRSG